MAIYEKTENCKLAVLTQELAKVDYKIDRTTKITEANKMIEQKLSEKTDGFTPTKEQLISRDTSLLPTPLLTPPPSHFQVDASGLYQSIKPTPALALSPILLEKQELRLDVDGYYPQMVVSGTIFASISNTIQWIANLTPINSNLWSGNIWYKDGDISIFPYTNVEIQVTHSWLHNQQSATVTFSGGGTPQLVCNFKYRSPYFHPVEFEFDSVEGTTAVTAIETHAHPNRPPSLPSENLSIEQVFARAGFDVRKSGSDNVIPITEAGADAEWSDMEMHDAMQIYWSRFANKPQWSMWVLFASLHETGTRLGGIMFDDIGPNHRQGTAIFNDSFIKNAPAGDANSDAWVQRMRFWTACHEMGHSFNLAHSSQKQHPPEWGTAWIPLANEPEARSFMNYPHNVSGGQTAFFADFEYRFSDGELLFMRHAPARFVQMGNANWFDHHGFQQANLSPEPTLNLELRVNRKTALFEFLEPVMLELKLTNISSQPQLIEEKLLAMLDHMIVMIKKDGKPARQWAPYAQYCWQHQLRALMPGESVYESLFVSAGKNGWDVAEPGYYTIQVALRLDEQEQDLVSNPLRLRIAPPRDYDEEFLAQDFFSEEVGRILTFDGSQVLNQGNKTLHEVTEKLSDRLVAIHAQVALGNSMAYNYKQLMMPNVKPAKKREGKEITVKEPANPQEAHQRLSKALMDKSNEAAKTLGHIDYNYYITRFSKWLAERGNTQEAVKVENNLYQTLSDRNVLDRVLQNIKKRSEEYEHQQIDKAKADSTRHVNSDFDEVG